MTDNVENLILEHLRAIRTDVSAIKADIRELILGMSTMENYMASFHLEIARHHGVTLVKSFASLSR